MKKWVYILLLFCSACVQDLPVPNPKSPFKTKYVFVVVMDGARYSETWGEPTQQYIPHIKSLVSQGVMCDSFWNGGQTMTVPGHTAMTTGNYQVINNGGFEIPAKPSIFQYYLKQFSKPAEDAWVISTKDKLEVLSDCVDANWVGQCRPRTDCGVDGNHTGYREDSTTYSHFFDTISKYHPHLVLLNFKQPDMMGHANNWQGYLAETKRIDKYIDDVWNFLQADPVYSGKTTMIVTNDHGRHLTGTYDGFVSHWCSCMGCRRIFMLGLGPDFKQNYTEHNYYTLVDIPATISKLLGINFPSGQGKVMTTILK